MLVHSQPKQVQQYSRWLHLPNYQLIRQCLMAEAIQLQ